MTIHSNHISPNPSEDGEPMSNSSIDSIDESLKAGRPECLVSTKHSEATHRKRKGKQFIRNRIINYLHSIDEPKTAHDISYNLNLSKNKCVGQLRILVNQKFISSKSPLKHLGERFATIYWYKVKP